MTKRLVFTRDGVSYPSSLLHEREEWGLRSIDIVNPPHRFWADQNVQIPAVEPGIDANRVNALLNPVELLSTLPAEDNWSALSRRSIARLQAHFLICEDPQRRMDAREVETLAHQVSLVRHVLDQEHLRRVLIADEVGLGKTVEAGLLIKELLDKQPGLRVLYLSPARLVSNVRREFDRLGLHFRQWTASDGDARLTDQRIIASIHRAVHGDNSKRITETLPWDILVVDECHHLSAWEAGGGDPREAFKLVRTLIQNQRGDGRVMFLSGTPHQGNITRFENLLALLCNEAEPSDSLSGRVIYRTKDDVRDWNNNLLFPSRQVNDPLVVDLGPRYRTWIENIHAFYKPPKNEGGAGKARQRAAGWRCAQALQWAASSPQAGVGYLVRQAIRGGWDLSRQCVRDSLTALRPYRMGRADEPVDQLFARIVKEVTRQQQEADVEDIEADDAQREMASMRGLDELLTEGLSILRDSGNEKWMFIKERLLDTAGSEKVVLFAQPIETVVALARFLERETGQKPALIIGGQSDAERDKEVNSFRRSNGPQFLVSSRAGGEGINLQVARRLIHIDVPWNPMDLEQRVGRVHRFGSRQTILVDTVVVKDSREADAYRIARQKLEVIASTLVEPERFESIFSRVMCLVPPEELQTVLMHGPRAPFNREDQDEIAQMVQRGFRTWRDFHDRYGDQQKRIRQQNPGLANWGDVMSFLQTHSKARLVPGYKSQRFVMTSEGNRSIEEDAPVLSFDDDTAYVCGDVAGAFVSGPDGAIVRQIGLNIPPVTEVMRGLAFPPTIAGAAYLRWQSGLKLAVQAKGRTFGVLVYLRQTVRTDQLAGWSEQASTLHCYVVNPQENPVLVEAEDKGLLLRGIFAASIRTRPEQADDLLKSLQGCDSELAEQLRKPTESELRQGVRHAVTPLLAAIIGS